MKSPLYTAILLIISSTLQGKNKENRGFPKGNYLLKELLQIKKGFQNKDTVKLSEIDYLTFPDKKGDYSPSIMSIKLEYIDTEGTINKRDIQGVSI